MNMNGPGKMKGLLVAAAQILTITLLAACTTADAAVVHTAGAATPQTICHATGDPANPYIVISLANDISPVPANGCPASPVLVSDGKIRICHATGSQSNPYNELTVSVNGLDGHGTHAGDVFPASGGGCPTSSAAMGSSATPSVIICHATGDAAIPYEEITVSSASLSEYYRQHPDDISPAPMCGCPTSPLVISGGKITICHATSSETNPYNEITVSVNGLNGHGAHEGDIIPAPETGCPAVPLVISSGKVTICHATGSQTNPYNEITVSVNGLNGHDKHEGDIVPAPAGGCPTSPKDDKPKNDKKP